MVVSVHDVAIIIGRSGAGAARNRRTVMRLFAALSDALLEECDAPGLRRLTVDLAAYGVLDYGWSLDPWPALEALCETRSVELVLA